MIVRKLTYFEATHFPHMVYELGGNRNKIEQYPLENFIVGFA